MTLDTDDLLNSIKESLNRIDYIKADEIPNIDLYMDQVTTFMDIRLRNTTRNKEEDKVLTKTMINNYAKNDVLVPPVKKKYTKDHVISLLIIYYFKNILSINDIQSLLKPLNEKYFGKEDSLNLKDIYEELRKQEEAQKDNVIEDIVEKFNTATKMFETGNEEDDEQLALFSFVTLLTADVYIKKLLIEKLIDGYNEKVEKETKASKDNK